jgi:hypothetical protein
MSRPDDGAPSDEELIARLRDTFRHEADAVVPFAGRPRGIAAIAERRARLGSIRRRGLLSVAAAVAVGALVAATLVLHDPRHPTSVGVAGPISTSERAPATTTPVTTAARPAAVEATPTTVAAPPPTTTPATATATTGGGPGPVPGTFVALSVTFVSPAAGWVLGTVPCRTARCLALARTTDGGATWTDLGAPRAAGVTGPAISGTGGAVDLGVRFADADDGWIYGSVGGASILWATHDGGVTWAAQDLPGVGAGWVVDGLETTVGEVRVAVLAADPAAVRLLAAPVGTDDWSVAATALPTGTGPTPSPDLVLQQTAGWVVEDNQAVLGGARLTGGTWVSWSLPCLAPATGMLLAAPTTTYVVAVCDEPASGSASAAQAVLSSTDGGTTFRASGTVPTALAATAVASAAPGVVIAGGTASGEGELSTSRDGGATWTTTYRSDVFTDVRQVGFENASQGVAVLASSAGAELLMTFDGGETWQAVDFQA